MPVDFNTRAMILTAVDAVDRIKNSQATIPVYNINFSSSILDEWTIEKVYKLMMETLIKTPFLAGVWYPKNFMTKSKVLNYAIFMLCQLIPACIIDALSVVFRRKSPKLVDYQLI